MILWAGSSLPWSFPSISVKKHSPDSGFSVGISQISLKEDQYPENLNAHKSACYNHYLKELL